MTGRGREGGDGWAAGCLWAGGLTLAGKGGALHPLTVESGGEGCCLQTWGVDGRWY